MRPIALLAAAAAIVVLLAAGVVLLGRPTASTAGAPPPSPTIVSSEPHSASASPEGLASAAAPSNRQPVAPSTLPSVALPTALQYSWIGAPQAVAGVSNGQGVPLLSIAGTSITAEVAGSPEHFLGSSATVSGAGQLALTLDAATGACPAGDMGAYAWSVTPAGATLTLRATQDACTARAAAFAGTWTRSACRDTTDLCLGAIPAGSYVSTFLDVRSAPGAVTGTGAYGQLRYSVPAGWANAADWPTHYVLMPAADYAGAGGDPEGSAAQEIWVFARPAALANPADCSATLAPGVGQTPSALAAWVASRPGVLATKPAPITVGGHTGLLVDVSLSKSASTVCPGDSGPSMATIMDASGDPSGWNWAIDAGEQKRYIFLDLGSGRTVAIVVDDDSATSSQFFALVAHVMPIIATFQFAP